MTSQGTGTGTPTSHRDLARRVIQTEADAVRSLLDDLDESFDRAVETMRSTTGRVVVTGIGKSGIIGQKIAATLASTGTASLFLHPAEALHGDLGMIVSGDVVLALSYSGDTQELVQLLPFIKRQGALLISLTGRPGSTIAQASDVHVCILIKEEACPLNLAPTASTTAQLAMGDALAMALSVAKGFREEDFAALHPGGKLGKRLMKCRDLMHQGDRMPTVGHDTPMKDVIYEMSRKGLGITGVVDGDGSLIGVISDGDLRRLLEQHGGTVLDRTAEASMTPGGMTIEPEAFAALALHRLEERKITSLFVVDEGRRPLGVVHLHDLWGLNLL